MKPTIDIEQDDRFMGLHQFVKPYTITSIERQYALYQAILYLHANRISGDIVECGVWKGGSAMLAAALLAQLGDTGREFWLYDTFEGMTPHGEHDLPIEGVGAAHFEGKVLAVGWEQVGENLALTSYPHNRFILKKGDVQKTLMDFNQPDIIALLHLDTDWYESTKIELEELYPRVVKGGVVIVDDYGHWLGQKKAVDEYLLRRDEAPILHRLDYSGRMWVKA